MRGRSVALVIGVSTTTLLACEAMLGIADQTTGSDLDADSSPDIGDARNDADTGAPSSGSRCDESDGYFLCDGFEHGLAPWTVDIEGDGGLSIDDAAAKVGSGGLLAQSGSAASGPATAFLGRGVTLPDTYTIRFFVRLAQAPENGGFGLLYLYDELEFPTELRVQPGPTSLNLFRFDAGSATATAPFPVAQWVCIEWTISPGSMTVRQDGLLVLGGPFAPHQGSAFQLGLRASDEAPSRADIDEIIIGKESPGCDR
jgi:hypothetical protein